MRILWSARPRRRAKVSQAGKDYLRLNVRTGDGDKVQWVNVTSFDLEAIASAEKLVKGARVYVEGQIKLDRWTDKDGTERHGLSCLSWHTRLSAIGRNKTRQQEHDDADAMATPITRRARERDDDFDSEIPF
jgi:single-strand DNA-binding protein